MVITKILRLFTVLLLLSTAAQAHYGNYTVIGCVSDDTGWLYTNDAGMNSARGSWYGPAYETTPVVTSGQIGSGIYCSPVDLGRCVIRSKSDCRDCTGPYDYDSSWYRKDNYYEQAGRLKGYFNCPIDDYVGFIVAAMAGLGFLVIRKSSLLG